MIMTGSSIDAIDTAQAALVVSTSDFEHADSFARVLDLVHAAWSDVGSLENESELARLLDDLVTTLKAFHDERSLLTQSEVLLQAVRTVQACLMEHQETNITKPTWMMQAYESMGSAIVLMEERIRAVSMLSTLDYDIEEERLSAARSNCQWAGLMFTIMRANPADVRVLDDSLWRQISSGVSMSSTQRTYRLTELRKALHMAKVSPTDMSNLFMGRSNPDLL
jgi:hypothetical protein